LAPGRGFLQIALKGQVTEQLVVAINGALEALRRSDVELAKMPLMRVERGVWRFNTYVPSDNHSTILLEGFATPAAACGWMAYETVNLMQQRYDIALKLLAGAKADGPADKRNAIEVPPKPPLWDEAWKLRLLMAGDSLGAWEKLIFVKAAEAAPTYRPLTGVVFGGGGQTLMPNPVGSMDILADTVIPLEDRNMLVFGCGWDTRRSQVHEMMARAGVGAKGAPDLDIQVFLCNKWGETLGDPVNPKTNKAVPGITMSPDNRTGAGSVKDDERFVLELNKLHPVVDSLIIAISIASGADSFSKIHNAWIRMLDVNTQSSELEIWRYCIDNARSPDYHRTALLCKVEHSEEGGWQMRTIAQFVKPARADRIQLFRGDVLSHINGVKCKPCTSFGSNTFAFNMSTLGKALAFNVCRLTFKRPNLLRGAAVAHLASHKIERAGTSFDLVFDPDGDKDCGIVFKESKASIVVNGVKANFNPKPEQLLQPIAAPMPPRKPVRVRLSNIKALIPCTDRGGTTDPYLRICYKTPKASAASAMFSVKDFDRTVLAETKPLKKVRCPAEIDFSSITVEAKTDGTMVGQLPRCTIEVMDSDSMSRDDWIFRHDVDLTWMFAMGDVEHIRVQPRQVNDIEDYKANAGFTRQSVLLSYTATAIYE
jgi:stress response protein SCP2